MADRATENPAEPPERSAGTLTPDACPPVGTEIRVPKLNNNDQVYTLVEWHAGDEQPIGAGDAVATVETSKAAEELPGPCAGVLWRLLPAGAQCEPGQLIGRVVPPGTPRDAASRHGSGAARDTGAERETGAAAGTGAGQRQPGAGGPIITQPAQALIDELGIDPARVRALGLPLVRAADVRALAGSGDATGTAAAGKTEAAASGEETRTYRLPPGQRAVARRVLQSARTIPAAYTALRFETAAAEERARSLGRRLRKPVGLAELLIAAVAPLYERFPLFFATTVDDETAELPRAAHVGVTVDVGKGLFVPVIENASSRTVEEIVTAFDAFRRTARRGVFREQDLNGGNITVTLHHEPDVVTAVPLIFPGQTCSLALTSTTREAVVDGEGQVTARSVATIGAAYDHRFVNGRDAILFLREIKEFLESPDPE